jgi:hypothetical protein
LPAPAAAAALSGRGVAKEGAQAMRTGVAAAAERVDVTSTAVDVA